MSRGIFITLEGPDGAGKTTQIQMMKEYLESLGKTVLLTREPGGTGISEKLREILLDKENAEMSDTTEMMIYAAARAQHVAERIRPALERGDLRSFRGFQRSVSGIRKRPGRCGSGSESVCHGWAGTGQNLFHGFGSGNRARANRERCAGSYGAGEVGFSLQSL